MYKVVFPEQELVVESLFNLVHALDWIGDPEISPTSKCVIYDGEDEIFSGDKLQAYMFIRMGDNPYGIVQVRDIYYLMQMLKNISERKENEKV